MSDNTLIRSPDHHALEKLVHQLAATADELDRSCRWPAQELSLCAQAGVYRWFVPQQFGGMGWEYPDRLRGLIKLAAGCLTTTFSLTQQITAAKWIVATQRSSFRDRYLPGLLSGKVVFNTGLSQLTTSRQHWGHPAMVATEIPGGVRLNGLCPWVTGVGHADFTITGATLEDRRQLIVAVPQDLPGVHLETPVALTALSATHTASVRLEHVEVPSECILQEPVDNVMVQRQSGGTGSLDTSALALGVASAAVNYLTQQGHSRPELRAIAESFRREHAATVADLLMLSIGGQPCTKDQIRVRANDLVLRLTHAALIAAKGEGFLVGHPTSRWCREAQFFLVWSCPQAVAQTALQQLAQRRDL